MHSTDYSSSNYESVNNSIRAKSKLGFLENLNAKLAEQRLSGKAFAVRSIINSKALVSWFKSTQFNFFLNSYFSTGKNGIYFGVHINIFIYCFCLHIVLVEIDRIFFYCSFSHFLSFEIIVWYAIKINKISRYKNEYTQFGVYDIQKRVEGGRSQIPVANSNNYTNCDEVRKNSTHEPKLKTTTIHMIQQNIDIYWI